MSEEEKNITEIVVAKSIFNRTRELLADPENVERISFGRYPEVDKNFYNREHLGEMIDGMSEMGYYSNYQYSTKHARVLSAIDTQIYYAQRGEDPTKADRIYQCREELDNQFSQIAINTIIDGLQDGSIPMDFASQTDEEIIQTLIDSDGTKEREIESQIKPIRLDIRDRIEEIIEGPEPVEVQQ